MSKNRISRTLSIEKATMVFFMSVMAIILISSIHDSDIVIIGSLILLGFVILFYVLLNAKTIEYDEEYMYVTGRNYIEQVPLKNVHAVLITSTKIKKSRLWMVTYFDNYGKEKNVKFMPSIVSGNMNEFINIVKQKNGHLILPDQFLSFF